MLVLILMVSALPFSVAAGELDGQLVILHTNDTHGHDNNVEGSSLGTGAVSGLKKAYEAKGADVLLLSAGDAVQGTPLVNVSQGENAIQFMNAAGYDAMAIGNHEFDYGFERLLELEEMADFPMLAANITSKESGKLSFTANTIITLKSGRKVGIFGLTTPETMTSSHPDSVKGVNFDEDVELLSVAEGQVNELQKAGCDFIIALSHLGTDAHSSPNRSIDVAAHIGGIDLIIDGHSHTTLEKGLWESGTLIVSTGEYLNNIGLVVEKGGKLSASLVSDDSQGRDTALDKKIQAKYDEIQEEYSRVFAETEVDLNGTRQGGDITDAEGNVIASFPANEGNRVSETNLGAFAADAQLYGAEKVSGMEVDVSIVNGGNVRASIPKGGISMNDIITVFPFANTISIIKMTGAELLEALEAACYCTPDSTGAFPQIAGMSFTLDIGVPYEKGARYPDSTYYAPANPGSRVKDVVIGGHSLDLEATYTIATNDFLAAGGDSYYAFKKPNEENGVNTGYALEDSLIDYIAEALNGVIDKRYTSATGRISIINRPDKTAGDFSDLPYTSWFFTAASYVLFTGTMNGYGTDTFLPAKSMTRAEFYQTLYNFAGNPENDGHSPFTDVDPRRWYASAASWAASSGLAEGKKKGAFAPYDYITRQEMAKSFVAFMELHGLELPEPEADLTVFTDSGEIAPWAVDSMKICVDLNIINGSGKKINPKGNVTRAQLAQIFYNFSKINK